MSKTSKNSRWTVLWRAIVRWWKNESSFVFIEDARQFLREYDDLYGKRVQIGNSLFRSQAAEIVLREGHKRKPSIESEVRVLALTLERIVGYLKLLSGAKEPRHNDPLEEWGGKKSPRRAVKKAKSITKNLQDILGPGDGGRIGREYPTNEEYKTLWESLTQAQKNWVKAKGALVSMTEYMVLQERSVPEPKNLNEDGTWVAKKEAEKETGETTKLPYMTDEDKKRDSDALDNMLPKGTK